MELLKDVQIEKPLIVAGGLTPENVAEAVREMQPYAVDVASGVENREGFKDQKKMEDFVLAGERYARLLGKESTWISFKPVSI